MMEKSWREGIRDSSEVKEFQELHCGKPDILKKYKEEDHVTIILRRGGERLFGCSMAYKCILFP